jgi:hypothetical protein
MHASRSGTQRTFGISRKHYVHCPGGVHAASVGGGSFAPPTSAPWELWGLGPWLQRKVTLRAVAVSWQREPPSWRWVHRCYLLPSTQGVHGAGEGALCLAINTTVHVWCGRPSIVRAGLWQRTIKNRASSERAARTPSQRQSALNASRASRGAGLRQVDVEVRGRSSQPPRGHKEPFAMRFHGTLRWMTMSGVAWVLESVDYNKSRLDKKRAARREAVPG